MKLTVIFCTLLVCASAFSYDKTARAVTIEDVQLLGDVSGGSLSFVLTAMARVENSRMAKLPMLSGPIALTDLGSRQKWGIREVDGQFVAVFERAGKFPIELKFQAAVRTVDGWKEVNFQIAPGALQSIRLKGLPADTEIDFDGAARPERHGSEVTSILANDGKVKFRWKEAQSRGAGKLFYAAEMVSQVSVSPGVLRQVALVDFKVMQGELRGLSMVLRGPGELTRVQGDQVLTWNTEPIPNSMDRRLVVKFNQPQTDQFSVQIQAQASLGAFPQTADVLCLEPESATRFTGFFRIVNDGAVRLEVARSPGLSQISPEQFPETDRIRGLMRPTGSQRFAYRFSGPDFALRIQADQILPELTVSEVLSYHLAENELTINGEFEVEVLEAPLRELNLSVPGGYAVARLNVAGLSDYFLIEPQNQTQSQLRLVFAQPVSGRQLVQLRLERSQPAGDQSWSLPTVEILRAKSVRGYVAASADTGFRLSPVRTSGLTEIAGAFFPRKLAGIQSAFRLSEPNWQAVIRVERLPQTVQADALHLFSIGEGIAYGSSLINYTISGAPVSVFRVELSDEYFNVEFAGKDVRNWQKVAGGYQVQLHTAISGSYTLLATYERPFKPQGDTLAFTGARPLDAQSEQGHTLVISTYQFQVTPVDVSTSLLPLEAGEVPPEYRLFFDSPILAAYQYASRPFNLKLTLNPLAQGDSLSLVVDRASLVSKISKEGQVVTDVRYFIKNRGNPHLRLTVPDRTRLWSATVNGASVVPAADSNSTLIPLPPMSGSNPVVTLDLKLASASGNSGRVRVVAPTIGAPVMLAEWRVVPDTGQELSYRGGSLTPASGDSDNSGFGQIARTVARVSALEMAATLLPIIGVITLGLSAWWWAGGAGVRFGARHLAGLVGGLLLLLAAIPLANCLVDLLMQNRATCAGELVFLAPVQQAGATLSVEVDNSSALFSLFRFLAPAWPALLALPLWIASRRIKSRQARMLVQSFGWLVLAWAALRLANGAIVFLVVLGVFLLITAALPLLLEALRSPAEKANPLPSKPGASAATATLIVLGSLVLGLSQSNAPATPARHPESGSPAIPDSVDQQIRVEDAFAMVSATIRWQAEKDQRFPLLFAPAVLTGLHYPQGQLRLEPSLASSRGTNAGSIPHTPVEELVATRSGAFDIALQYEIAITRTNGESGFVLPVQPGLINRLTLILSNLDVEVTSSRAVSVHRESSGSNTVATLMLSPAAGTWIGWKPRTRDLAVEKPVFYAELAQIYAPAAGVIEGAALVSIRLAQGELKNVDFEVPAGLTVTDVLEHGGPAAGTKEAGAAKSIVSIWRFDPDTRRLQVSLGPPQSRSFALLIKSQFAAGPLPFEKSLGLLKILDAADQVGLVALATDNAVQLDTVNAESLVQINLEDFPASVVADIQAQVAGAALRRAFRYSNPEVLLSMKASAVQPDIRVESQDTVSLGEDRTVLAANATVSIARAGIFRLSFALPLGFDVESISGPALSHWTESKTDTNQIITLHLNGQTEGQQQFAISLAGPGARATNGWVVPQLVLREASKHTGTLLLVPEQGLRLQPTASTGLSQLDPQKAGIKQKGVLAFRVLQPARQLQLALERVEPWIQVNSLQHAVVGEAQTKIFANLQYEIENSGLKMFHVLLPTNAEAVRFEGDQVSDFLPLAVGITNGLQSWEIRLNRRVIGTFLLHVSCSLPLSQNASSIGLRGVRAVGVNLQRGYVTIQSSGRLQVRSDSPPAALQAAEWQSIPRVLQQGLPGNGGASFTYRLVEPDFVLPLRLERYQAAQLLPARVSSVDLHSVISDNGVMLTQAALQMYPGEKRLLRMTLPPGARFWFAFVNQTGVWPWRENDQVLIPLEQQAFDDKLTAVEVFFTSKIGAPDRRNLNLELLAPRFDLPLENITWHVGLSEKWKLRHWTGTLQLQGEEIVPQNAALDLEAYLSSEALQQQARTRKAEDFLAAANTALAQGKPQQARRAFQSAFGLSTYDAAFNEDARVQLHNIKLQEALVGLNVRQADTSPDSGIAGRIRQLRDRSVMNYSQQDAKDIIERNSADENAAFMRLAERLIQQQDAAVSLPAALHASIPSQGRTLTFKRAILVDPWAILRLNVTARSAVASNWQVRSGVLTITLLFVFVASWVAKRGSNPRENPTLEAP